ncbi:hypothetical protein PRtIB026_A35360 [Pseudomonas sp. RtIB026]|uniref:HEPN domain-containing protein n=1 Tax=Pseudomonas sp. RtIB026 TaxID=2749999 RepID=UPI001944F53B|nr:HEPN domain-containing protein [Pseudomonas sp. RtIB026]BCJ06708.1 hypothetical protein PRtIB026_A35360 [Pseudomonas sp. RtIB026]
MNDTGFAFVLNNLDVDDADLPFVLDEKSVLRRATTTEQEHYKKLLKHGGVFSAFLVPHGSVVKKAEGESGPGKYVSPEKSALLVVEARKWNQYIELLNLAGKLVSYDFTVGGHACYSKDDDRSKIGMHGFFSHSDLRLLEDYTRASPIKVSKAELCELGEYYRQIEVRANDAWLRRALSILGDIHSLPRFSELRTLSYFSVLECILTKKSTGGAMSIDKQLQHKTELLCNFTNYKAEPIKHFGEVKIKNLWKILYELRSHIAHGNVYSFTGELTCLGDLENVNEFLSGLVRKILCTALNQYQLVADLREC